MLEGAGFSRSNPYYIVKQGKVSLEVERYRETLARLDYPNGHRTRCHASSTPA